MDAFYITSDNIGLEILIEKHWSLSSSQILQKYWPNRHQPIATILQSQIVNVHYNNLFFIMSTSKDTIAIDIFHQLSLLVELFLDYFGDLSPTIIKDNFTTVYEAIKINR